MLPIQKYQHFFPIQGGFFCPTSAQHLCKLIDSPVTSRGKKSRAEQPRPVSCLCHPCAPRHYQSRSAELGQSGVPVTPRPAIRWPGGQQRGQGSAQAVVRSASQLLPRGTIYVLLPCKGSHSPVKGSRPCLHTSALLSLGARPPSQPAARLSQQRHRIAEEEEDSSLCCRDSGAELRAAPAAVRAAGRRGKGNRAPVRHCSRGRNTLPAPRALPRQGRGAAGGGTAAGRAPGRQRGGGAGCPPAGRRSGAGLPPAGRPRPPPRGRARGRARPPSCCRHCRSPAVFLSLKSCFTSSLLLPTLAEEFGAVFRELTSKGRRRLSHAGNLTGMSDRNSIVGLSLYQVPAILCQAFLCFPWQPFKHHEGRRHMSLLNTRVSCSCCCC
ncbi:uncharacterized protein [Ciconia boyciana]|uniref:uncharacterized protein n=1 Tax=Ciconia boyciana TaxID=52775 RepID=UPI003BA126D8